VKNKGDKIMPLSEKARIIAQAEARIEGFRGEWVTDAKSIIEELRLSAEIGADAAFSAGLSNLDRHMAQAPVMIYQAHRGQIGL
jgi:hypothetical protein